MERLTRTSDFGEAAFIFDLYINCLPSEAEKILKVAEKLKEYEDLEEQGLLLRLLCGIGSDIYFIPSKVNFRLNLLSGLTEENRVFHQVVDRITFRKNGWYMECDANLEYGIGRILRDENYGVTWFLSKEEAEAKLKEMEDANVHERD